MNGRRMLRVFLLAGIAPGLTGCIGIKTRTVQKTVVAEHVLDATLDQMLASLEARYSAIQTLTATVSVTASTGGEHEGEVKEIPTFSGYILLRKPKDLQILLKLPVIGSMALDMVTDGSNFKLFIPPKNRAVVGSEEIKVPSKNGLENLRPGIIRDSLLVPGIEPDQFVTLVFGSRTVPSPTKKNERIEEPDYDLTFMRMKDKNELEIVRVVHISRMTLLPYQQDVYEHGRLVTTVSYGKYQKFGEIEFPVTIEISRPVDEYDLKIDINKLVPNQKLDDEQFKLDIPKNVSTQTMQ